MVLRPFFSPDILLQFTHKILFLSFSGMQEDGLPLEMPILDGVFIRKAYRRQGWGTEMMKDIMEHFPEQDVGLSQPISQSLELGMSQLKILCRVLHMLKPIFFKW